MVECNMRFVPLITVIILFVILLNSASAVPPGKIVSWEGGGAGRVVFEGSLHKDKGFKCRDCHTKIFANMKPDAPPTKLSMKDMNDDKSCGTCHNGKKAFSVKDKANCLKCHKK